MGPSASRAFLANGNTGQVCLLSINPGNKQQLFGMILSTKHLLTLMISATFHFNDRQRAWDMSYSLLPGLRGDSP
jgi:hypothetical protein